MDMFVEKPTSKDPDQNSWSSIQPTEPVLVNFFLVPEEAAERYRHCALRSTPGEL